MVSGLRIRDQWFRASGFGFRVLCGVKFRVWPAVGAQRCERRDAGAGPRVQGAWYLGILWFQGKGFIRVLRSLGFWTDEMGACEQGGSNRFAKGLNIF